MKNCQKLNIFKSFQFLMVQGSLNPNITFLGEKLWPAAWNKKFTSVIYGGKSENANRNREYKNKCVSFSCPKDHSTQKLGVLCSPRMYRLTHTDRHTRKWIHRTPFQGFRNFSFNLSSRISPTGMIDRTNRQDCQTELTYRTKCIQD